MRGNGADPRLGGQQLNPLGYRPHLDGLRAVAVYLVVLFHGGIIRFNGGFIGVDVFFVLSGYLVTDLLVRDLAVHGRVPLARFYARRVRRLLPAAVLVLVATAVVFSAISSPYEWDQATDAMRAAAVYLANWFYVAEAADYFADDVATSPVLHFWSLAIEEQFYVVWPLLLAGLYRLFGKLARPRRAVQTAVALGALASLSWALSLASHDLNRAYYGTDARAYQLLAGALLALSPGLLVIVRRRLSAVSADFLTLGAGVALLVAATSLIDLNAVQRGLVATVLTLVLVASLDAFAGQAPRGVARRALSLPPVVYLGRISYGTYLWHWLVIIVLTRELQLGSRSTTVVTMVVATGLASLSYQLVEHPIRSWPGLDRYGRSVAVSGLALGVVVGFAIVPAVFEAAEEPVAKVVAQGEAMGAADATLADIDWQAARADEMEPASCTPSALDDCVVVEGDGPTIMVLGDSHALMYVPMLEHAAKALDMRLVAATRPMCAWYVDVSPPQDGRACHAEKVGWYGPIIDHFDPDVVVLAQQPHDDPRRPVTLAIPGAAIVEPDDPAFGRVIEMATQKTIDQLRGDDRKVVIIEPAPIPRLDEHPLECLSRGDDINACRFVVGNAPTPEERFDRALASEDEGIWTIDLDQAICPYLPICDPVVDGLVVMSDRTHITGTYSASLGPLFTEFLLQNRIVEPA